MKNWVQDDDNNLSPPHHKKYLNSVTFFGVRAAHIATFSEGGATFSCWFENPEERANIYFGFQFKS